MWKACLHETSFPDLSTSILFVQLLWLYTNEDNNNSLLTQNCQNYKDFRDVTLTTVTLKPPFTDVFYHGFHKTSSQQLPDRSALNTNQNKSNFCVEFLVKSRIAVYYYVYKNPPLIPTLHRIKPAHILPVYLYKFRFNILPSTPRSSKRFLSFNQNPIWMSLMPHACHMSRDSHPTWSSLWC